MTSNINTAGSTKSKSDSDAGMSGIGPGSQEEQFKSTEPRKSSDSSQASPEMKETDDSHTPSSPPPPRRKSQGALVTLPADKETQVTVQSQLQRVKTHARHNTLGIPIPGVDRGGKMISTIIPEDIKYSDNEDDSSTES